MHVREAMPAGDPQVTRQLLRPVRRDLTTRIEALPIAPMRVQGGEVEPGTGQKSEPRVEFILGQRFPKMHVLAVRFRPIPGIPFALALDHALARATGVAKEPGTLV